MRVYIGIEFEEELKRQISDIQAAFRPFTVSGRWKHVDNFHLTVKFLGEITHEMEDKIHMSMQDICNTAQKFTIKTSNLGFFPGRGCVRVVWLGIEGELNKLQELQGKVEKGMKILGFPEENRKFTPHVTLGQDLVFSKSFEELKKTVDPGNLKEINVSSIALVKSEQIGNRRIYTVLKDYMLR